MERATAMKTAQLHPNIRYVSLTDDDGDFGILLHHDGSYVYAAVEVYNKEMFTEVFQEMMSLREFRDTAIESWNKVEQEIDRI